MNDLLIDELYSKERGRRVEFFGIQLDEMWTFVQNKENKIWLWFALNPANRQIVPASAYRFHVGDAPAKMHSYFTKKFLLFLKEI